MSQILPIKVAYADDHAVVRKGICDLVNSLGFFDICIEGDNGDDLIRRLSHAKQVPSLCILDIFMPVMDGLQTMLALRKKWPEMKFLVLTGHNTDYYLIKMIRAGAHGYLLKNCSHLELEKGLKSILKNGIYYSDPATMRHFTALVNKEIELPTMSEDEQAFLKHCCSDLSHMQIAEKMAVAIKSVDWYRDSLFKKLNLNNRSDLAMFAVQLGLVPMQTELTSIE